MYEILLVCFLLVALALVGLVLIQQGKGADMGASFGSGSSNSMFGSSGAGNFLTRTTAILATLFFLLSLVLGNLTSGSNAAKSEFDLENSPVVTESSDVPVEPSVSSDVPQENTDKK